MGSDSHLARAIGEVANQKRRFDSCVIIFLIPLLVGVAGDISPTIDLAGTSPNNDTGMSRMFSSGNEEILVSVSMVTQQKLRCEVHCFFCQIWKCG